MTFGRTEIAVEETDGQEYETGWAPQSLVLVLNSRLLPTLYYVRIGVTVLPQEPAQKNGLRPPTNGDPKCIEE